MNVSRQKHRILLFFSYLTDLLRSFCRGDALLGQPPSLLQAKVRFPPSLPKSIKNIDPLQRASQCMVRNPHIDLGGFEVRMPEERLHHADVDPFLDQ